MVAPLLLLSTAAAAGGNTLTDFGYYYAMEMSPNGLGVGWPAALTLPVRTLPQSLPAGVRTLSTLCSQHGEPNSTITVSYTGLAGSGANDYIGLWCPGTAMVVLLRSHLYLIYHGGL